MTQTNYPTSTSADGFGALFDLSFTRFVTISMIKVIYILAMVMLVLGWLGLVIAGFASGGFMAGLFMLVLGSIGVVLYLLMIRVGLEVIVVVFRIGENTSIMAGRSLAGDGGVGFPVQPIEPAQPPM